MRSLFVALLVLAVFPGCRPTYAEVHQKYLPEYERAAKVLQSAYLAAATAPPIDPNAPCQQSGLTHALWGYDEKDQQAGNTEVLSYRDLMAAYDQAKYKALPDAQRNQPRSFSESPLAKLGVFARAKETDSSSKLRVGKEFVPMVEATRAVTHALIVQGEGTPHLEVTLVELDRGAVVCRFAVDGEADDDVVDKDYETTTAGGMSYRSTSNDVERSAIENAHFALSQELRSRFGFGLEPDKKGSPPREQPKELLEAKARLASMYQQRDHSAPSCQTVPAGAQRVNIGYLWWGAGVSAPKALKGFAYVRNTNEDLERMSNPFNPVSSFIEGAKGFLSKDLAVVYEPVTFTPPVKDAGGWAPGSLHVRALVFEKGVLACSREWDLVTPATLRVGLSHGAVTERSARIGAQKYFVEQLSTLTLPK